MKALSLNFVGGFLVYNHFIGDKLNLIILVGAVQLYVFLILLWGEWDCNVDENETYAGSIV